jgi:hypothetical protein
MIAEPAGVPAELERKIHRVGPEFARRPNFLDQKMAQILGTNPVNFTFRLD